MKQLAIGRTYIAGDPEAMNAVYERQKRTGLNLSEILASMKEVSPAFDIDNYGNGVGPSMPCPACGTTAITTVASRGYDGIKSLDCGECGEEILRD